MNVIEYLYQDWLSCYNVWRLIEGVGTETETGKLFITWGEQNCWFKNEIDIGWYEYKYSMTKHLQTTTYDKF